MISWLRWRLAWWRWFLGGPLIADPKWGRGQLRRQNLRLAFERHNAKEPKREDFQ